MPFEYASMTLEQARQVCAELVADGTFDSTDEAATELLARGEMELFDYVQIISHKAWLNKYG